MNAVYFTPLKKSYMKKLTLLIALLLALGFTATQAQENKSKKANFSWQKEYMDEAGIAADVQAKITTIKDESEVKIKEIKKDGTLTEEQQKEKTKEIYKKRAEDIFALLTKEQKEKIKEIRERIKKENGE